jgi:hypothetical protein
MTTRFRLEDLPAGMRDQAARELGVAPRGTSAKRPKYGNQVVEVDAEVFGSKWELKRFRELQEQERAGLIVGLRHHVSFPLHVMTPTGDRVRIGAYEADLVYHHGEDLVVEDTKSEPTRATKIYRWKAQHFELEYHLKVLDVVRVRRKKRDREVRCG